MILWYGSMKVMQIFLSKITDNRASETKAVTSMIAYLFFIALKVTHVQLYPVIRLAPKFVLQDV